MKIWGWWRGATRQEETIMNEEPTVSVDTERAERSERPDQVREVCDHCRGTGRVLTKSDLIRESLTLFPTDPVHLDEFVREFYRRLLAAAPALARLFPPDLVDADHTALESAGKAQRDRLLQAILVAVGEYDPEDPARMAALRTHLAAYGRSHRAFARPGGTVQHATMEEYVLVGKILMTLVHDVMGPLWRQEWDGPWAEAYEHAAVMMLHASWSETTPAAVARHPRRANDDTLRRA